MNQRSDLFRQSGAGDEVVQEVFSMLFRVIKALFAIAALVFAGGASWQVG